MPSSDTGRTVRTTAAGPARRLRLADAWAASRLTETPGSFREDLLGHATETHLSPGEIVRWDRPLLIVVMSGKACVFVTSVERCAALRYLTRGNMVGLATVFLPDLADRHLPMRIRAVTDCSVMELPPRRFASLAQRDAGLAWRVGQWIAEDMVTGHAVLADDIFLSVRQLVARHLLDLAVSEHGQLAVNATQQDLADAIGSVRAVVGRTISEMRAEGLVIRAGRRLLLPDPAKLHLIAKAG